VLVIRFTENRCRGTGSCSKPALFQVPNVLDPPAALPPVTVGDFWFANEIYTPP
jgi:hypothetical protein